MRNKPIRILTTLLAVMLCMAAFSVTALAAPNSDGTTLSPTQTDTPAPPSKPLTPDGTGTVINDTANGDGKEFLTITTPSKHVFYLIIDRQKDAENVYFLDAVTEKDLLALVQSEGQDISDTSPSQVTPTPDKSSTAESKPTTPTASQPKSQSSTAGIAAVFLLSVAVVVTVICFIKSRKPKKPAKEKADPDEYDFLGAEDEETESEAEPTSADQDKPEDSATETEDDE